MTDTIAAIATGMTHSGIGIIRISGTDAVTVADRLFVDKKNNKSQVNKSKRKIIIPIIIPNNTLQINRMCSFVVFKTFPIAEFYFFVINIKCHNARLISF